MAFFDHDLSRHGGQQEDPTVGNTPRTQEYDRAVGIRIRF